MDNKAGWRIFPGASFILQVASQMRLSLSAFVPGRVIIMCDSLSRMPLGMIRRRAPGPPFRMIRAGIAEGVIMKIGGWRTRSVFDVMQSFRKRDIADALKKLEAGYPRLAATSPGESGIWTCIALCGRHEEKEELGRLQTFSMREIVFVGPAAWVRETNIKTMLES